MNVTRRRFSVLVAEADQDEQFLFKVAISEIDPDIEINLVYTGRQVQEFLMKDKLQRELNRQMLPGLIIAGHREPQVGLSMLTEMRSYERFYNIPVILLSDETSDAFHQKALASGANEVHRKPATFLELKQLLTELIRRHRPKRLTKGLFCARCEEFIEFDPGKLGQITLSPEESEFISGRFNGSLCIPCIRQLKTSYRIIKGDYEKEDQSALKNSGKGSGT